MNNRQLLTWIELSARSLAKNMASLAGLASDRQMAISVKANAYGHGLPEMIRLLASGEQPAYVSVHALDEAVVCREQGWKRKIMMVGPLPLASAEAAIEYDLEPIIVNPEALERFGKLTVKTGRKIRTHLKLETGTHRQGIDESALPRFATIYKKYPLLGRPYGASMHFANIEDTTNHEYADTQLRRFKGMLRQMRLLGIHPTVRHTACSAALILFDKTRFELVRPGISAYGHWPSKETFLSYRLEGGENHIFEPILSWKTRVTQIKKVPADAFVGYGCTYRTTSAGRLAILPVGYSDGYDRALSNVAYVLIKGRRAPLRGRVCMNLMMVDITDIPGVKLEEEVVLIGRQGSETITAEQLAGWAGSIQYEILSRLNPKIERLIVK